MIVNLSLNFSLFSLFKPRLWHFSFHLLTLLSSFESLHSLIFQVFLRLFFVMTNINMIFQSLEWLESKLTDVASVLSSFSFSLRTSLFIFLAMKVSHVPVKVAFVVERWLALLTSVFLSCSLLSLWGLFELLILLLSSLWVLVFDLIINRMMLFLSKIGS